MRILILGSGSSIHVKRPLMQLLARDLDVVFADQVNPLPEGHPHYHYVWYPLFGKCIYRKIGHTLGDRLASYTFVPYLRYVWKKYQPDVVHVHWIDCHANYCVQANLHPLVLSVWGSDINNCFGSKIDPEYNKKIGLTLSMAQRIIVDSANMIRKCNVLAGYDLQNAELLHLGINPDYYDSSRNESVSSIKQYYKIPVDARVLLSVRGLSPLYQHEKILLAFAQVLPTLRKKTVLVFKRYNESNKNYYDEIVSLVKQLELVDSVYWLNEVSEIRIPDLYSISDVILNFPLQDTFPVTFLEAAVCEKPVITNCLPSYENTFASDYFRLVKHATEAGFAKAIFDELEVTPTLKEDLQAAHQIVVMNFSETHYSNRLVEIYQDLHSRFITREGFL